MSKKSPKTSWIDRKSKFNFKVLRRFLGDNKLQDKIICFIPSWEMSTFSTFSKFNTLNKTQIFYHLNRFNIFESILQDIDFQRGVLSFSAYRRIDKATNKEDKTAVFLEVIEDESLYNQEYFKNNSNIIDRQKIYVLCIDYSKLAFSLLSEYMNYYQLRGDNKNIELSYEYKRGILRLFQHMPWDTFFVTYSIFSSALLNLYRGENIQNFDKIVFASNNTLSPLKKPIFWDDIEKEGYLCSFNSELIITKNHKINKLGQELLKESELHTDTRIFYSLESLLCYEFVNIVRHTQRCKECGHTLPVLSDKGKKYKGTTCPSYASNYLICSRKRSRKRTLKFRLKDKNVTS